MMNDQMSAGSRVEEIESRPTFMAVVRDTLRDGPAQYRYALVWVGLICVAMLAVQIWDVRERRGPAVLAELVGVALGCVGTVLVGLTNLLHAASQASADRPPAGSQSGDADRIHHILIALPTIGFAAGALLAASIALFVMRGVLGAAPLAIVAGVGAFYVFLIWAAGRTVSDTTRLLYRHGRDRAAAASRAEAQATDARLSALQAQMNPHFLFNALNTVAALTRTDPRAAEATVENLADVLRRTLARSTTRESTLSEEIEYLRAYLAIEHRRMGARLRVEWDVPDALLATPMAPMTLQPLVENALKHGIGMRLEGGTIRVAARTIGKGVRIEVCDDGDGFGKKYREGTGLANLRERLMTLYGSAARLEIESPPAGARVVLTLPV
jgi:two-component sensor histidine kinase